MFDFTWRTVLRAIYEGMKSDFMDDPMPPEKRAALIKTLTREGCTVDVTPRGHVPPRPCGAPPVFRHELIAGVFLCAAHYPDPFGGDWQAIPTPSEGVSFCQCGHPADDHYVDATRPMSEHRVQCEHCDCDDFKRVS